MTQVYLPQIPDLKSKDVSTWNILAEELFSVNKSKIPFSAIDTDHGIEQEDRVIKAIGGIKGITNNQQDLDEFYLIASEFGDIIETFCKDIKTEDKQGFKRDRHYQVTSFKNFKINENVKNFKAVFQENEVKFEQSNAQDPYSLLTKKVLLQHVTEIFVTKKHGSTQGSTEVQQCCKRNFFGRQVNLGPSFKRKTPNIC